MIINLHLKEKRVIVIGGGLESLKKINSLLKERATILAISRKFDPKIILLSKQNKIEIKKMNVNRLSFIGKHNPFLVIAATNDPKLNKKIVQESKKQKILSYSVDNAEISDISFLSTINIKNAVNIGISTNGKSPIIAKKIRKIAEKKLNQIVSDEDVFQIKIQEIVRNASKATIHDQSERKRFLYMILKDKHIKQLVKLKKFMKAEQHALEMLSEWK